jgi:hypothetical protein
MSGTGNTHGEVRNTYEILVGKAEEKRYLRRPRRRWKVGYLK